MRRGKTLGGRVSRPALHSGPLDGAGRAYVADAGWNQTRDASIAVRDDREAPAGPQLQGCLPPTADRLPMDMQVGNPLRGMQLGMVCGFDTFPGFYRAFSRSSSWLV